MCGGSGPAAALDPMGGRAAGHVLLVKVESPLRSPLGGRGLLRLLQPSPRPPRPPSGGGGCDLTLVALADGNTDHPIQAKHAPLMLTVPPPLAQPAAGDDLPALPVDRLFLRLRRQDRGTADTASLLPPSTSLGRAGCGPLYELLRRRGCAGGPPCGSSGHLPIHGLSRRDCGVASGRPPSNGGTAGPSVHA